MKSKIKYLSIFSIVFGLALLSSCYSSKNLAYFNNIPRDTVETFDEPANEAPIAKNDILQIIVTSLDPQTTQIYNGSGSNSSTAASGYLVDETGMISLPEIGALKAEGLTKTQLAKEINNLIVAKKLAKDPIVTVRIINYKITVLGEVVRPGVYPVPNERITLPEALGLAGDLTAYGKRDNVLLIREVSGKRTYKRFDLNQNQMFRKDIYNLQNKDIIYIEPGKGKATAVDRTVQILPIVLSAVSVISIIIIQALR